MTTQELFHEFIFLLFPRQGRNSMFRPDGTEIVLCYLAVQAIPCSFANFSAYEPAATLKTSFEEPLNALW